MSVSVKFNLSSKMKKWDVVKISPTGQRGIVIRSEETENVFTTTMYPYKRKKTKFGRWRWLTWLKIKVYFKII